MAMGDAPQYLEALIERWEPDAFDSPTNEALIRLSAASDGQWDVRIKGRQVQLRRAKQDDERPDAALSADPETWKRIAEDVSEVPLTPRRQDVQVIHFGLAWVPTWA